MLEWQKGCRYESAREIPLPNGNGVLCVDLETTGLCAYTHRIVGIVVSNAPRSAAYVPVAHKQDANIPLFEVVEQLNAIEHDRHPLWVFYNAKFDLRFLERVGFRPRRIFDVQILWYNLRLAVSASLRGLKETSKKLLGIEMLTLKALFKAAGRTLADSTFADLPLDDLLLSYACADADITLRLYELGIAELGRLLEKRPESLMADIIAEDHKLIRPVMRMEDAGIVLDTQRMKALHKQLLADIDGVTKALQADAGSAKFKPSSPIQVAALLFDVHELPVLKRTRPTERNPEGLRATDSGTLKKLQRKYGRRVGAIGKLLECRELQSRARFVDKLKDGVNTVTDRAHPQYHIARQITGRLSSTGDGHFLKRFNFQGVPKLDAEHPHNIRNAFRASAGYEWISIDLSNIEIRLIANFSGDEGLIEELVRPGGDLHARTARELFGKDPSDEDWSKWRKVAKICNFNLAYAFGIHSLREKIEIETGNRLSEKECDALFERFFTKAYPQWGQYKRNLVRDARRTMLSTTLFGRERDLRPFYNGDAYYGCAGDRQAVNHPIQGSCADLLRRAILACQPFIGDRVRLLSTVHDELNFEVKTDKHFKRNVENLIRVIEWTPKGFVVPVRASLSVGPSWGEVKETELISL